VAIMVKVDTLCVGLSNESFLAPSQLFSITIRSVV